MNKMLLRVHHMVLAACLLFAAPALWSCNSQTTFQKQQLEFQNQLKAIDEDTIRNYLVRNKLLNKARRTNSGLYVVDSVAGAGTPVTTGKQVRLKYVGRFLSNGAHPGSTGRPASFGNPNFPQGAIFDNSSENKTQCGCVVFTGGSGAIPGFNEGLLLMRQGDRKLLLIPSSLAYASAGSSGIPPDATLMFDVEILEVF